jgi:hypothetical protein
LLQEFGSFHDTRDSLPLVILTDFVFLFAINILSPIIVVLLAAAIQGITCDLGGKTIRLNMNSSHIQNINNLRALVFRRDFDFHKGDRGNVAGFGKKIVPVDFTSSGNSTTILLDLLNEVFSFTGSERTEETQ